jgi:hypothetical protein
MSETAEPAAPTPSNADIPPVREAPKTADAPDVAASGSWNMVAANGDGDEKPMNVQADGAIGRDVASRMCPPGSTCSLATHEGERTWHVASHAPHQHPHMSVPQLAQTSGPAVPDGSMRDASMAVRPGQPMHTLAHVSMLAKHSKEWGHNPNVTFSKPGAMPTVPMDQPPVAMSVDAVVAAKGFFA